MPGAGRLRAVLFDYGRTLVTFDYPVAELTAVMESFRPAIEAALGKPAPSGGDIVEQVLMPLETWIENPDEDEVAYLEVYSAAWRRAGLDLPDALSEQILDAEQLVWDRAARPDPSGLEALAWLRAHGFRTAICSNAPFPPAMMLRQVSSNGIRERVDAVVFSSQVGRRKPAPEVYRAALDAIRVAADEALFVGDRVREDYEGPRAVGMQAVICTAHAAERPPDGVRTIESLMDVRRML